MNTNKPAMTMREIREALGHVRTERQINEINRAVDESFDQHEPAETRQARWEAAAHAAGREVDRNALAVYLAVADAEQRALADSWARVADASEAEILRLKARVRELERPAVEAKRAEIRSSYIELSAQAEQERDYEGAFDVQCRLREREEQWAREDMADPGTVLNAVLHALGITPPAAAAAAEEITR